MLGYIGLGAASTGVCIALALEKYEPRYKIAERINSFIAAVCPYVFPASVAFISFTKVF